MPQSQLATHPSGKNSNRAPREARDARKAQGLPAYHESCKADLAQVHQDLVDTFEWCSNTLSRQFIDQAGRSAGFVIGDEYRLLTKLRGDTRKERINKLQSYLEKQLPPQDPLIPFLLEPNTIKYYLLSQEVEANSFPVNVIKNPKLIGSALKALVPEKTKIGSLISPTPLPTGGETSAILKYTLAYFIICFTSSPSLK
jgi:hypothetical protein